MGKTRRNEVPVDWKIQSLLETESRGKLDQMKRLLFTPRCRKRFILEYFGDEEDLAGLPENCGSCDYCLEKDKPGAKNTLSIPVSAFEIALDAVEENDQKFGVGTFADVLRGIGGKRMAEKRLDEAENYGDLSEYSDRLVTGILYALIDKGYLEKTAGKYPVLKRTSKARYPFERESALKEDWNELKSAASAFDSKPKKR